MLSPIAPESEHPDDALSLDRDAFSFLAYQGGLIIPARSYGPNDIREYPERWALDSDLLPVSFNQQVLDKLFRAEIPGDPFVAELRSDIELIRNRWNSYRDNPDDRISGLMSSIAREYISSSLNPLFRQNIFIALLIASDRERTPHLHGLGAYLAAISDKHHYHLSPYNHAIAKRYAASADIEIRDKVRALGDALFSTIPGVEIGYGFIGDIESNVPDFAGDRKSSDRLGITSRVLDALRNVHDLLEYGALHTPIVTGVGLGARDFTVSTLAPVIGGEVEDRWYLTKIRDVPEGDLWDRIVGEMGGGSELYDSRRNVHAETLTLAHNLAMETLPGRTEAISGLAEQSDGFWNQMKKETRAALTIITNYRRYGTPTLFFNHVLPYCVGRTSDDRHPYGKSGESEEHYVSEYPHRKLWRMVSSWLPRAISGIEGSVGEVFNQELEELHKSPLFEMLRFWAVGDPLDGDSREHVEGTGEGPIYRRYDNGIPSGPHQFRIGARHSERLVSKMFASDPVNAYRLMCLVLRLEWIYNNAFLAKNLAEKYELSLAKTGVQEGAISLADIYPMDLLIGSLCFEEEPPEPVSVTLESRRPLFLTGGNGGGKSVLTRMVGVSAFSAETSNPFYGGAYSGPQNPEFFMTADEAEASPIMDQGLSFFAAELMRVSEFLRNAEKYPERPLVNNWDELHQSTDTLEGISLIAAYILYLLERYEEREIYMETSTHAEFMTELEQVMAEYGITVGLATMNPQRVGELIPGVGKSNGCKMLIDEGRWGDGFCSLLTKQNKGERTLAAGECVDIEFPRVSRGIDWVAETGRNLGILGGLADRSRLDYSVAYAFGLPDSLYFFEVLLQDDGRADEQRALMRTLWENEEYRKLLLSALPILQELNSCACALTSQGLNHNEIRELVSEFSILLTKARKDLRLEEYAGQESEICGLEGDAPRLSLRSLHKMLSDLDANNEESLRSFVNTFFAIEYLNEIACNIDRSSFCLIDEIADTGDTALEVQGLWNIRLAKDENRVLNNVSLSEEDAFVGIVGTNTAGKTFLCEGIGQALYLAKFLGIAPAQQMKVRMPEFIGAEFGETRLAEKRSRWQTQTDRILHIVKSWEAKGKPADSFFLFDEIGNATSATDAIMFAKALIGILSANGATAFFSTHFHNLCDELNESLQASGYVLGANLFEDPYLFDRVSDVPSDAIRVAAQENYGLPSRVIELAEEIAARLRERIAEK